MKFIQVVTIYPSLKMIYACKIDKSKFYLKKFKKIKIMKFLMTSIMKIEIAKNLPENLSVFFL